MSSTNKPYPLLLIRTLRQKLANTTTLVRQRAFLWPRHRMHFLMIMDGANLSGISVIITTMSPFCACNLVVRLLVCVPVTKLCAALCVDSFGCDSVARLRERKPNCACAFQAQAAWHLWDISALFCYTVQQKPLSSRKIFLANSNLYNSFTFQS